MSAESAAAPERDRPDLPAHLTREGSDERVTSQQFLRSPSEAYCTGCGRRVTVGKEGTEYGHKRHPDRCEYRSEGVDPFDVARALTPSEEAAHGGRQIREFPEKGGTPIYGDG